MHRKKSDVHAMFLLEKVQKSPSFPLVILLAVSKLGNLSVIEKEACSQVTFQTEPVRSAGGARLLFWEIFFLQERHVPEAFLKG